MGLDITAYRGLKEVRPRNKDVDDDGYEDSLASFYDNANFPGRFDGLKPDALYSYTENFHFRAGAYSGYNWWREELAKLAGYPAMPSQHYHGTENLHAAACWGVASGPFAELINFADNEGTIGPVVAAKLAKDFAEWDERAKAHAASSNRTWWYDAYQKWRKAFEMAADNGAVDFH